MREIGGPGRPDYAPGTAQIKQWRLDEPEFEAEWLQAKETLADTFVEEIIEIADDRQGDYVTTEHGVEFDSEHVQRARLKIDARKWVAARLRPKKYGDKVALTDPEGGPLQVVIQRFADDG